jgi:hypothetical protein
MNTELEKILLDLYNYLLTLEDKSKLEQFMNIFKKYLIIIPAGDRSRHMEWKTDPSVDLCVIYYNNDPVIAKKYAEHATYFYQAEGPKWKLLTIALKNKIHLGYKYVWLPDDDLIFNDPNQGPIDIFRIVDKFKIDLSQPALIDNGNILPKYKKNLMYQPAGLTYRYTNFVEIMAPMLSDRALSTVLDTIIDPDTKSGWGLDTIWPLFIKKYLPNSKIAIINAVPIVHTVPISKPNMSSSFYMKFNIDPYAEMKLLINRYKI